MRNLPSYKGNETYYNNLIDKINEFQNFPEYLKSIGYKVESKSSGSVELRNGDDKIVIAVKKSPMTYFNRNDSNDKGTFFNFIKYRDNNFYDAINTAIEVASVVYDDVALNSTRKASKNKKSLEENYNVVTLEKEVYLTKSRNISSSTINSELFKNRIFNAYHIKDNGSRIPNIAFPKYDIDNNIKNYVLRNKEYLDRSSGDVKSFKLVLNDKDSYLWTSNIPDTVNSIYISESEIDALSHYELNSNRNSFYISAGGNIYDRKIDQIIQWIELVKSKNENVSIVSITDNDYTGLRYDLDVMKRLISSDNSEISVENSLKNDRYELTIHYKEESYRYMDDDYDSIKLQLEDINSKLDVSTKKLSIVRFKDKLVLDIPLYESIILNGIREKRVPKNIEILTKVLSEKYLSYDFLTHKSSSNDWNEELGLKKQGKLAKTSYEISFKVVESINNKGVTSEKGLIKINNENYNISKHTEKSESYYTLDFLKDTSNKYLTLDQVKQAILKNEYLKLEITNLDIRNVKDFIKTNFKNNKESKSLLNSIKNGNYIVIDSILSSKNFIEYRQERPIQILDKIVLNNSFKDADKSLNEGTVIGFHDDKLVVDFGLKYSYLVKASDIKDVDVYVSSDKLKNYYKNYPPSNSNEVLEKTIRIEDSISREKLKDKVIHPVYSKSSNQNKEATMIDVKNTEMFMKIVKTNVNKFSEKFKDKLIQVSTGINSSVEEIMNHSLYQKYVKEGKPMILDAVTLKDKNLEGYIVGYNNGKYEVLTKDEKLLQVKLNEFTIDSRFKTTKEIDSFYYADLDSALDLDPLNKMDYENDIEDSEKRVEIFQNYISNSNLNSKKDINIDKGMTF